MVVPRFHKATPWRRATTALNGKSIRALFGVNAVARSLNDPFGFDANGVLHLDLS